MTKTDTKLKPDQYDFKLQKIFIRLYGESFWDIFEGFSNNVLKDLSNDFLEDFLVALPGALHFDNFFFRTVLTELLFPVHY